MIIYFDTPICIVIFDSDWTATLYISGELLPIISARYLGVVDQTCAGRVGQDIAGKKLNPGNRASPLARLDPHGDTLFSVHLGDSMRDRHDAMKQVVTRLAKWASQAAQLQVFSGPTGAVVLRFPQDERLPSWDGRPRDVRQVVGGPKGGRLPPAGPAAGTCVELSGRSGKRDCDNQEV